MKGGEGTQRQRPSLVPSACSAGSAGCTADSEAGATKEPSTRLLEKGPATSFVIPGPLKCTIAAVPPRDKKALGALGLECRDEIK